MGKNKKFLVKVFAVFMALNLFVNIGLPTVSYALTAGPSSPEFASFEPVATTDMVNVFSGDMTYNLPVLQIPGPDGGGYSLSLSYHSGTSSEEEASWVGHGWTLNPGAINRSTRGFPDDYENAEVDFYNKTRANWTLTSEQKFNIETFSKDAEKEKPEIVNESFNNASNLEPEDVTGKLAVGELWHNPEFADRLPVSLGVSTALRFNNYQGFNRSTGLSAGDAKGMSNLSLQFASSGITFAAGINPLAILSELSSISKDRRKEKRDEADLNRQPEMTSKFNDRVRRAAKLNNTLNKVSRAIRGLNFNLAGSEYGLFSFSDANRAATVSEYEGFGFNYSATFQVNPGLIPIGGELGVNGSFAMQYNLPKTTTKTFGYMYNPDLGVIDGGNRIGDYYVEKGNTFSKRDYHLGIPFSNPDIFSVTGEGMAGGFRMYSNDVGHYYPNFVASSYNIINLGNEFMLGGNVGAGVDFGVGNNKSRVKDWGNNGNADDPGLQFEQGLEPIVRYNNDLGGKVEYANNSLYTARLNASPNFPGIKSVRPNFPNSGIGEFVNANDPNLDPSIDNINKARRGAGVSSFVEFDKSGKKIAGVTTTNADGTRYKYGRPVMTRNEASISIDAVGVDPDENNLVFKSLSLDNNYVVDTDDHNAVLGEIRRGQNTSYATAYLLTEITSFDYVDANNNGEADDGDFGGWTKFNYNGVHGTPVPETQGVISPWYRWRVPYTGLEYSRNSVSDVKDDLGSVSTGEKQVYYLESVETKTHVAYFVTNDHDPTGQGLNSGIVRKDGLGAPEITGNTDPAADDPNAKGLNQRLQHLEKIVLYSKARMDKPIKVVNFEYDYSLVPNLPNNEDGSFPANNNQSNTGKLTLKRVWFDFEGTVSARISPYEFTYKYKDVVDYPQQLKDDHPELTDFFNLSNQYSNAAQNPDYGSNLLDAWGNNQANGRDQFEKDRPWPFQGDISNEDYDPAAWQLKQIKLPSGGEILIEYEQKDYRFVQDRETMAMVSLASINEREGGLFGNDKYQDDPTYTLNLADIGLVLPPSPTPQQQQEFDDQVDELVERLDEFYAKDRQGNRIYFKFLYDLINENPDLTNCTSEYITGYAVVSAVTRDGDDIVIELDGSGSGYDTDDQGYSMVPAQGCYDFYSTQRLKKFQSGCEANIENRLDDRVQALADPNTNFGTGIANSVQRFGFAIEAITDMSVSLLGNASLFPPLKANVCKTVNLDMSYFKILMPSEKPKRGGGVRVKRLLLFDEGIEAGDAAIYGNEYAYEDKDGLSSGVATTEPTAMREENALVGFVPRGDQSWFSRHTVGKDKEQTEGPFGESLLPAPSVGHSRVVVKNIHEGETGDGFTVHEFHTVKDYPFDKLYDYRTFQSQDPLAADARNFDIGGANPVKGVQFTTLADNQEFDLLPIPAGIFSYLSNKAWAAQGYRFIVNNMHGQPKSVKTFSGTYDQFKADPTSVYLSSAQVFEFFEPGEQMRMAKMNHSSGQVDIIWDNPGKEMELAMEMKSIKDRTLDFNLEMDISIGTSFLPPIFIGVVPSFGYSEKILSTHMTSKVLRYPAVQKSVQVYQDGIWSKTEYLAFDEATGNPIVTRTTDAYDDIELVDCSKHDGSIYATIIPAHWHYIQMGGKYEVLGMTDPDLRSNQLSASAGSITTYGLNGNPIQGDKLMIPTNEVLNAKAQTFDKGANIASWIDPNIQSIYGVSSTALTEMNNFYRQHEEYLFKENVSDIENNKLYESGIYNDFVEFDYTKTAIDPKWLKMNEVTKYSPNGNALEEKNILDIYSTARFGYNFTVPTMIAQNARYGSVFFQDYENHMNKVQGIAHSGDFSLSYGGAGAIIIDQLEITDQLRTEGGLLQLWLKTNQPLSGAVDAQLGAVNATGNKVAQTGEWSLYTFVFDPADISTAHSEGTVVNASLNYALNGETIHLDDVRFQPNDAEATCFVYDVKTLRLVAQFDDQHFGLFFQYNDEGQLVRKLIETERGLKTIQESQFNVPKQSDRNQP